MQYVLGLSFFFKYYRNPANVRVYSDNTLIDDICLDKDIKLSNFDTNKRNFNEPVETVGLTTNEKGNLVEEFYGEDNYINNENDLEKDFIDPNKFPEKLFLYTLEGEQLGRNISLEIHNDNTNYTNGFMTKYSYIVFYTCFLMPLSLLHTKYWFKPWRKVGSESCSEDYTNIMMHNGKQPWPSNLGSATVERNGQKGHLDLRQQFGGSFNITWPLQKRFGVHYIGTKSPAHFGSLWKPHKFRNLMLHYNILNTENENKRNHNA